LAHHAADIRARPDDVLDERTGCQQQRRTQERGDDDAAVDAHVRPFAIQHDAGYDLAPEGGQIVLADWLRHLLPVSNSHYA